VKEEIDVRIALYQPDIAPNAGALFRLASVIGTAVDLIGPAGFVMNDRRLRRASMDYFDMVNVCLHDSWDNYLVFRSGLAEKSGRIILLTTSGDRNYVDFSYRENDTLLVGRETAGVPSKVHEFADARLRVPMLKGRRSLNVVVAAAMVVGEAFRQTGLWNSFES
jgi:tRNA (cytidine/uridine-2'-O-)-methyltransferase